MKRILPLLAIALITLTFDSCDNSAEKLLCEEYVPLVECDDFPPAYELEENVMTQVISGHEDCFTDFEQLDGSLLLHVYVDEDGLMNKWELNRELDAECNKIINEELKGVKWSKAVKENTPTCYYVVLPIKLIWNS